MNGPLQVQMDILGSLDIQLKRYQPNQNLKMVEEVCKLKVKGLILNNNSNWLSIVGFDDLKINVYNLLRKIKINI